MRRSRSERPRARGTSLAIGEMTCSAATNAKTASGSCRARWRSRLRLFKDSTPSIVLRAAYGAQHRAGCHRTGGKGSQSA